MKTIGFALVLLATVAVCSGQNFPSVFRFGTISWVRTANLTVLFTVRTAWSAGPANSQFIFNFGDSTFVFISNPPSTAVLNATDLSGEPYQVFVNQLSHTYAQMINYQTSLSSCCRISTLQNAPNFPYAVDSLLFLQQIEDSGTHQSPVYVGPVIVQLPIQQLAQAQLAIGNPEGDSFNCSFADQSMSFLPPTFIGGNAPIISPNCTLSWNTSAGLFGQKFALQVLVTVTQLNTSTSIYDGYKKPKRPITGPFAVVPIDFIVELTNATTPPIPIINCSATASGIISLLVGQSFSINFTGVSTPAGLPLGYTVLGAVPTTSVFVPPVGSSGVSPFTVQFFYTAVQADANQNFPFSVFFIDPVSFALCSSAVEIQVSAQIQQGNCTFNKSEPLITRDPPALVPEDSGFVGFNQFQLAVNISCKFFNIHFNLFMASNQSLCSYPGPFWTCTLGPDNFFHCVMTAPWDVFAENCGMRQVPGPNEDTVRLCGEVVVYATEMLRDVAGMPLNRSIIASLPFCVDFPTSATAIARDITVFQEGQPIIGGQVEAAIVKQEFLSPFGRPTINPFGPFGKGTLRLLTATPGQLQLNLTAPFITKHNDPAVSLMIVPNSTECTFNEAGFCLQYWTIMIFPLTPSKCELDGTYWTFFNLICQPGAEANGTCSNSQIVNASVMIMFDLDTQSICPTVLDQVSVTATLMSFLDPAFVMPSSSFLINTTAYFQLIVNSPQVAIADTDLTDVQVAQAPPGLPIVFLFQDGAITPDGTITNFMYNDSLPFANEVDFKFVFSSLVFPLNGNMATSKTVDVIATVNVTFVGTDVPSTTFGVEPSLMGQRRFHFANMPLPQSAFALQGPSGDPSAPVPRFLQATTAASISAAGPVGPQGDSTSAASTSSAAVAVTLLALLVAMAMMF